MMRADLSDVYHNFRMTVLTGKDLIVHITVLSSGTHLHEPTVVLNLGESASLGTGITISTLFAVDRLLN